MLTLRLRKPSERRDKSNVKTHRRVIVRLATAVLRLKIDIFSLTRVWRVKMKDVQAKSRVTPKGVPNSSFRAYRLPIDVFESSTRENTPALRNFEAAKKDRLSENREMIGPAKLLTNFLYERIKFLLST